MMRSLSPPCDAQAGRQGPVLPLCAGLTLLVLTALQLEFKIRCLEPSLQGFKALLGEFSAQGCSRGRAAAFNFDFSFFLCLLRLSRL